MSVADGKQQPEAFLEPLATSRRPNRHFRRGHSGAWKVAYADLVTAMMALFIVLWVLNQGQSVQQAIAVYFNDPTAPAPTVPSTTRSGTPSPHAISVPDQKIISEFEKRRLAAAGKKLRDELAKSPEFAGLMGQIKIEVVRDGLRIEVVDSTNDIFFEIGNSELKPPAVSLMERIGNRLKDLPNTVIVEGHTDSRPYQGQVRNYSNFELSADRANSARRAMMKGGLQEGKIEEVRGYANSLLRDTRDPFSLVNRRISILVKFMEEPG